MKKCAVWVLLFGAAFSLFAQNVDNVTIFIPQVTGTGSTPDDNTVFTDILIQEMQSRNLIIKETQEEAEYALIGTIAPSNEDSTGGIYMLSLALFDKNGWILYEQVLFYTTQEEANSYIPTVLLNMLSNIFTLHVVAPGGSGAADNLVEAEDAEAWRNKLWYIGANVFWTPRIYYGTKTEFFPFNFGWGLSAEFHLQKYAEGKLEFLKYLAVGTGLYFASDWIIASPRINDDYRNTILQIPITIYGVLKPGAIFLHEPYLGIAFNIPTLFETIPSLLSWKVGFQFGIKAGKGVLYGDAGFSMDFGKSSLNAKRPGNTRQYDRYMIYLGIGYKYDLVEPTVEFIKNIIQDIKDQKAKSAQEPVEETEGEATVDPEPQAAAAPPVPDP
jgi:hypothetical protein